MLKEYIESMNAHIAELHEDLTELTSLLEKRNLNKYEQRAAERLLQLYVEACIGIAKQCVKKLDKTIPNDAFSTFKKLADANLSLVDNIDSWHKVIGLRNVLVHDYLNIDQRIITSVLKNKNYEDLNSFINKGLAFLYKQ